jgi:CheY-like chemotaxis protein
MRPKKRILLAGGDELRTSMLRFMLVTRGYAVTASADASDALARIAAEQWDLVLLDLPLPGAKQIADTVHADAPHTPTLLIVGKGQPIPADLFSPVQVRSADATELLECVKFMCARKRGPRKGTIRKPVASVGAQLVDGELVGVA